MSQLSSSSGTSELLERSKAQLHGCRWGWCRLTFNTHESLKDHVIHVHTLEPPVKRRELEMIKRAEEGTGDSLNMSEIMCASVNTKPKVKTSRGRKAKPNASAELEPSSSLPSPPVSSSALDSPGPSFNPTTYICDSFAPSHSYEKESQNAFDRASPTSPLNLDLNQPTTPQSTNSPKIPSTPSFISLSSPAKFPSIPAIPESPCFNALVKSALHIKDGSHRVTPSSTMRISRFYHASQDSISPSGSQESVEQQLTQSLFMDDDMVNEESRDHADENCGPYAGEIDWKMTEGEVEESPSAATRQRAPLPGSPTSYQLLTDSPGHKRPKLRLHLDSPLPSPPPLSSTHTPIRRQAWYQPPRPHHALKRLSGQTPVINLSQTPSASASHSPISGVSLHPVLGILSEPNAQRPTISHSETLNISTMLPKSHTSPVTANDDSQDDLLSQGKSQGFSYPMLQSQAPYESQTLSQY